MPSSSPLAQSARAITFRGGSLAGAFVTQALLARGLGPVGFGTLGVLTANLQLASQVSDLGGEPVSTRLLGLGVRSPHAILRSLVTLRLVAGTTLLLVTVISLLAIRPPHGLIVAILLGALSLPLGALASGRAALVATSRFDAAQAAVFANAAVVLCIVAAAFAFTRLSLALAFGAMTLGALVSGLLVLAWTRAAGWRAPPDLHGATVLLRTAAPLAGSLIVGATATRLPPTIVVSFLGASGAGLFYAVYKLLDLAHLVPQNVLPTIFPSLVHVRHYAREGQDYYRSLAGGLAAAGTWLTAAFVIGAPAVVRLAYGARFERAAPVMAIVGWALPLLFLSYAQGNLLIAKGRYADQFRVTIVSAVSAATLYPLLCALGGLTGAGVAAVLCESTTATAGAFFVWRRFNLAPVSARSARHLALALLAAIAATVCSLQSTAVAILFSVACAAAGVGVMASLLVKLPVLTEAESPLESARPSA